MAISLQKGQRISLEKNGKTLKSFCIGVNWGAIEKRTERRSFFGGSKLEITKEAVDLDASVGLFSVNKSLVDVVYFGHLISNCNGVHHSGDDRTGDMGGDDGLDNEVITVNLDCIAPNVNYIVFVLNSFQGHDFKDIPFATIRLYEGTPKNVVEIFATYDIAHDAKFSGSVSMIMGKLYKHNGAWKFNAIGVPTKDRKLQETLVTVANNYL